MIEYSVELHKSSFAFLEKAETETLLRVMSRVSFEAGDLVFQFHISGNSNARMPSQSILAPNVTILYR